ncbi:MAG: hypothetical protein NW220_19025 [Leptolyngbyaceae cyanobacterium bins.349]|nr:hypothetical protein [Leptolyngbyaceae cyanobacterium bins.349]
MTTTPTPEPTLQDLVNRLDQTLADNERFKADNDRFKAELDKFNDRFERNQERFDNYQKATQWVVQLAFTLIASATITVIITSVFRK